MKIHLRAAPKFGVSSDGVREVLMQTAIYCGVAAALDSFRAAQQIFDEQDGLNARTGSAFTGCRSGRNRSTC